METVEEYYAGLPEQSPGLKAVGSQILSLSSEPLVQRRKFVRRRRFGALLRLDQLSQLFAQLWAILMTMHRHSVLRRRVHKFFLSVGRI